MEETNTNTSTKTKKRLSVESTLILTFAAIPLAVIIYRILYFIVTRK